MAHSNSFANDSYMSDDSMSISGNESDELLIGSKFYTNDRKRRPNNSSPIHTEMSNHVHFIDSAEEAEQLLPKKDRIILSQKYESLDYDTCENSLYIDNEHKLHKEIVLFGLNCKNISHETKVQLNRWILVFFIGFFTASIGALITITIDILGGYKYRYLKQVLYGSLESKYITETLLYWYMLNIIPVAFGSALVTYWAPIAAGSGIPVIKCYLNGIKVPEVVRFKTLLSKAIGVVGSVVGGLSVGKEGPMIHCGAVIAAGVSQGKSSTFRKDLKIFEEFREDQEKRDFVSAGAAAGVAAAFGAPIGGVLFSLEEGASFWNQSLTWRIFFCSLVSTFTLNTILSYYHGHPGELNYSKLFNFGKMQDISYEYFEIPMFIIMGTIGGLMGALFNHVNHALSKFRLKYIQHNGMRILEALCMCTITATVGFIMIIYTNDCKKLLHNATVGDYYLQINCPSGHYNTLGSLLFQTPEACVKSFFTEDVGAWEIKSLAMFFILFQILTCMTYGLSISSGLFIPSLMVGAAWGRMIGAIMLLLFPQEEWINPSKFALIGAAANLGGVVRMTISLTVILLESTGNLSLGLPLMLTLLVSKWVGDHFNEGLYDIHIQLSQVPILGWDPPPMSHEIVAADVMSSPVVVLNAQEKVGTIVDILETTTHNGFPVITQEGSIDTENQGIFQGLILRWQLVVMLHRKLFMETAEWRNEQITLTDFRNDYPRFLQIWHVHLATHEKLYTLDLTPVMNPSPYTVHDSTSLKRMFRVFRALGLRHLVVVDHRNQVVGMVTRKDLARFKYNGETFEQLLISTN